MPNYKNFVFSTGSFVDLTLYQFGYEECSPSHFFGPAERNHFLFHYIVSGRGYLLSTNEKNATHNYQLEKDQGFMIWPKQRNTYYADEKEPWVYIWIEFDGLKAQELITQSGLSENYPIYAGMRDANQETLKNEMLYIVNHPQQSPLELIGHLYLTINALINSSTLKKTVMGGTLQEFYVRESIAFIEQNYKSNILVDDISSYCNIDRSYLGKIFKKVLGYGPQEFLIQYRINKACEMLKITNYTIGEISRQVGYDNPLTFSRVFKNTQGVSPREWRLANKLKFSKIDEYK